MHAGVTIHSKKFYNQQTCKLAQEIQPKKFEKRQTFQGIPETLLLSPHHPQSFGVAE